MGQEPGLSHTLVSAPHLAWLRHKTNLAREEEAEDEDEGDGRDLSGRGGRKLRPRAEMASMWTSARS